MHSSGKVYPGFAVCSPTQWRHMECKTSISHHPPDTIWHHKVTMAYTLVTHKFLFYFNYSHNSAHLSKPMAFLLILSQGVPEWKCSRCRYVCVCFSLTGA